MFPIEKLSMEYVDSVLIVDKNYMIVHSLRFNPRFDIDGLDNYYSEYLNRNFFEVYPDIKVDESSVAECLKKGKPVLIENQIFRDFRGRVYNTKNITIPIIKRGEIVGVIELSKDITSINDLSYDMKQKPRKTESSEAKAIQERIQFDHILTSNDEVINTIRKAKILCELPNPTLIYGETGTGKELLVQAMFNFSNRSGKAFIAQNCAALPESLFESILFGSMKGAYTGAENNAGLFELANGGTLFLDELNSMPYGLQAKLLRVLQDGVVRPIGSNREKRVDVKVIAAMNMDPSLAIDKGLIREDLFYRFSSSTLVLAPLRERTEDILLYTNHFIKEFNTVYKKHVTGLSKELLRIFSEYRWPGNVRELKHIIESMVSLSDDAVMTVSHLPVYMQSRLKNTESSSVTQAEATQATNTFICLEDALSKTEKDLIIRAVSMTGGNLTKAGALLKIPRQTLKYKINKYKMNIQQYK